MDYATPRPPPFALYREAAATLRIQALPESVYKLNGRSVRDGYCYHRTNHARMFPA
jgi:hypothetical protein